MLGRPSAVWSPAKQKSTASVTDPSYTSHRQGVREVLRGRKKDLVRIQRYSERGSFREMDIERHFQSGHLRTSLASFCWSCGTRWLEQQTICRAVATESRLLWWLNCLERVPWEKKRKERSVEVHVCGGGKHDWFPSLCGHIVTDQITFHPDTRLHDMTEGCFMA